MDADAMLFRVLQADLFCHFWLPRLSHLTLKSSGFGEAEGELSGPERGVSGNGDPAG